ncbi:MAG: peptidoglycan DD-metalloendopeptidase family protein [Desulfobacterales bacterium]
MLAGSAAAEFPVVGVVSVDYLNFRPEPAMNTSPITSLRKGERLIVLQIRNGWIKAVWQGRMGYVRNMEGFVKLLKPPGEKDASLITSLESEAEGLGEHIEEGESRVAELNKKEITIINGLNEIDLVLNSVRKKISHLEVLLMDIEAQIWETAGALKKTRKDIAVYKTYAGRRIVALYKLHKLGGMPHVLTSADSMYTLFKRKTIFERILQRDQAVLAGYARDVQHLHQLLNRRKEQQKTKKVLNEELDDQLRIMVREKEKREKLLVHIRKEKRLELAVIESLRLAAASLDKQILNYTRLPEPEDLPDAKSFVASKGLIKLPVRGKVISFFGPYTDPKYNIENFRNGIDIQTERGEPVRAVCGGKVLYADWFKGYGNMMIIDHGDHYYSVYANMEEMFKTIGSIVTTGEVIATAGDSGSLTGPKLYFEIRHHGKAMDPLKWIKGG